MTVSKVPELATCIGNAYNTCDSSVVVFLPDAVAVKAAYIGLCNKKAGNNNIKTNPLEQRAGLTCMTNSGVDVFALGASCLNITAFTNVITEAASGSWQGYCSYIVTMYDCYMDGYTCDDEFETAYRNFAKALLPSKCRDFSTSLSPWIATYGAATT
ncbi:hypothetical protein KUTeg_020025 [Tegillarca granosa]|uniref:Uncharacterized protein n=1 Tax=Tegillarca granosa TaxID=220873 RepID=A0ABQ9EG54_TEGGR|nr:hypothetical protein KUTeg_020025 [Tegillarca granosa]